MNTNQHTRESRMKRELSRSAVFLIALVCAGGFFGLRAEPNTAREYLAEPESVIRLSPDPDHVVLDFALLPGLMDRPIVMTVSAGGLVQVTHPFGRLAGTRELRLGEDELEEFFAGIARHEMLEMTTESLRHSMNTARRPDGVIPGISDPSIVTITFSFESYQLFPDVEAQSDFEHILQFRSPGFYAKHYPHLEEFRALDAAYRLINELLEDSRLRPTDAK